MNQKADPYATKLHKRVDALLIAFIIVIIALLLRPSAKGDQNWDGDNAVGNFSFGNNWFGDFVGGSSGFGFGNGSLHFSYRNNASQTSIYYDFAGFADTNDIIWDNTFGAGLTINGNGQGLNFNQRLQNNSSFTQTIGSSMNLSGAKNGAAQIELNPVNGDLTIDGNIFNDNSKAYHVFGNNGKTLTLNSTLGVGGTAANVSFTVDQNSNVNINAVQTYAGGTTISAGSIKLSGSGTLGVTSGSLTVNSGVLDLNGTSQNVGALNGSSSGQIKSSAGTASITVGNGNATGSFAGSISNVGSISVTKTGTGTQTLTGNNSYTGATAVSGGTLQLANGSGVALSGTSGITVSNAGTLLMGASNQVNLATTPPITLAGGKINAGGFNQGNSGTQIGLGALTLTSSSIIDLSATSLLHFASSSGNAWVGTLSIYNWSGIATFGNGAEQLLFGTNPTALTVAQLNSINFYSDNGTTFLGTGMFAPDADGEVVPTLVPVPEPSTWAAAALALGAIAWTQRKRFALRKLTSDS